MNEDRFLALLTRKKVLVVLTILIAVSVMLAFAVQYSRTPKMPYRYEITTEEMDVWFVARDRPLENNTTFVYRASSNGSLDWWLDFGHMTNGSEKTFTAAFGIVNELPVNIKITGASVDGSGNESVKLWLHNLADSNTDPSEECIWNGTGVPINFSGWVIMAGDGDMSTAGGITGLTYDANSHTKAITVENHDATGTDMVWVKMTLNVYSKATYGVHSGTIFFYIEQA